MGDERRHSGRADSQDELGSTYGQKNTMCIKGQPLSNRRCLEAERRQDAGPLPGSVYRCWEKETKREREGRSAGRPPSASCPWCAARRASRRQAARHALSVALLPPHRAPDCLLRAPSTAALPPYRGRWAPRGMRPAHYYDVNKAKYGQRSISVDLYCALLCLCHLPPVCSHQPVHMWATVQS